MTPATFADLLERPAPPHGALRFTTYCDGADAWWPGCGSCGACGGPMGPGSAAPRQNARWFCSRRCERWWRANHQWAVARAAALKRDRRCRRCHRAPPLNANAARRDHSGVPPVRLEVNHKSPLEGRADGYQTGCQHHLDGLEALCKGCHADVTAEQGAKRREQDDAAHQGS